MAGPARRGFGAGAGGAGFTRAAVGASIKPRFALLTVGALRVPLAVQAHTGLGVAVAGVVVAMTGSAACATEVEETGVAVVTFGPVHSGFTLTSP